MHKRKRDIEQMIANLGLKITGFRTDGTNHWRVDVAAPNGRQRPFTFSVHGHDGGSRRHAEEGMVRRWRREVAPEMESAEEAGQSLDVMPEMESALASELRKKVSAPVRNAISEMKATEMVGGSHGSIPPFEKKRDTITVTHVNKEPVMQVAQSPSPSVDHTPPPPEHKRKHRDAMSFQQVMAFGAWMNKERLEGFYTKIEFVHHATKTLGFPVSEYALNGWLDSNNAVMPQRPDRPKSMQELLNEDIAAIALAMTSIGLPQDQQDAMLAIVDRRTKG